MLFACQCAAATGAMQDDLLTDGKHLNLDATAPASMTGGSACLTPMQDAMFRRAQLSGDRGIDVELIQVELKEEVHLQALRAALDDWTVEFETLRTTFTDGPSGPLQMVQTASTVDLNVEDLRHQTAAQQSAHMERTGEAERRKGFVLGTAPLVRVRLFQLADSDWQLTIVIHHLLYDGRCAVELVGWLFHAYDARVAGRSRPHEERPSPLDFARHVQAIDFENSRPFWTALLSGAAAPDESGLPRPTTALPTDAAQVGYVQRQASSELGRALARAADRLEVTPNAIVQVVWAVLLARYSGHSDQMWGTTRVGRGGTIERSHDVVGMCINTVVSRLNIQPSDRFSDLTRQLRQHHLAVRDHQQTPAARVHQWVGSPTARLFDTLVVYENYSVEDALARECSERSRRRFRILARPGLSMTVMFSGAADSATGTLLTSGGRCATMELVYERSVVSDRAAGQIADHILTLLASACAEPDKAVAELAHLPPERRQWLAERSRGRTNPYPANTPIHHIFEQVVKAQPNDMAVVSGPAADLKTLTYRQLGEASDRLAEKMVAAGVRAESHVAIMARRSPEFIVAVMAVLKAGGAYVPLESDSPPARLDRAIASLVEPFLVIDPTTDVAPAQVAQHRLIELTSVDELLIPATDANSPSSLQHPGGQLANIIFTSGSTGQPKGVRVTHKAIVRLTCNSFLPFARGDRYLLLASPAFDASTLEIFGPLLTGGTVVVHPHGTLELPELRQTLREHRVQRLWLTASLFNMIIDSDPLLLEGVETVMTGGEALSPSHVRRAQAALPGTLIINGYGPTENTTFSCTHALHEPLAASEATVPIGRPIDHSTAYVLDKHGHLCDTGFAGELCLGGDGLADGYLGDPDLTHQRYVPAPSDVAGNAGDATLYRSGDLCRMRDDGMIEFIGRRDEMVKIRGFRVDLGEIDAALASCVGVRSAASLIARRDGHKALVAFIVCHDSFSPQGIRQELKALLPDYMIPREVWQVNHLPLTPNGKLDRDAIQRLPARRLGIATLEAEPRDYLERQVRAVVSSALGVTEPDMDAGFFDLGGHSLTAVDLTIRLERDFGVRWTAHQLVSNPTIRELADEIRSQIGTVNAVPVPRAPSADRTDGSKPSPVDLKVMFRTTGGMGPAAAPPVFLVPGMDGFALKFRDLAQLLPDNRAVCAVRYLGLEAGESARNTVEDYARDVIDGINQLQPTGMVHLIGHSFGATIIYEVMRRLEAASRPLGLVAMIDHPTRQYTLRKPTLVRTLRRIVARPTRIPSVVLRRMGFLPALTEASPVPHQLQPSSASNGWQAQPAVVHVPGESVSPEALAAHFRLPVAYAELSKVTRGCLDAYMAYEFPAYTGSHPVHLFVTSETVFGERPDMGWRDVLRGSLTVHRFKGHHTDCLNSPQVEVLASLIRRAMQPLDPSVRA